MTVAEMLEETLSSEFVPGSNLRGSAPPAEWVYLLQSLEVDRIVCFGAPAPSLLRVLVRLGREVSVVPGRRRDPDRRRAASEPVETLESHSVGRLPARSIDLAVVVERPRDPRELIEHLRHLLAANGAIYLETAGGLGGALLEAGFVERTSSPGERPREGVFDLRGKRWRLFVGADAEAPPRYLRALAGEVGMDLSDRRFTLTAPATYPSRKTVFRILDERGKPECIVKMPSRADFNGRLENEHRALVLLDDLDPGTAIAPHAVFFGYHAGLAVLGESVVEGVPLRSLRPDAGDSVLRAAVDSLVDLGGATISRADPAEVAAGLEQLLHRYVELYRPSSAELEFLSAQLAVVAASEVPFPLVVQHGDPHVGNVFATPAGGIAFLDWEAFEARGMPLWDVFYLVRSHLSRLSQFPGRRDPLRSFRRHVVEESSFGRLLAGAVAAFSAESELPPELVEPLLHTCWMHRALKEAMRLTPGTLHRGRFVRLLRLCIAERERPGLRHLFAAGGAR